MHKELTAKQCENIIRLKQGDKDVCPACFNDKDRKDARCCKRCREEYKSNFSTGKSNYSMFVAMKRYAILHQMEFELSEDALNARS